MAKAARVHRAGKGFWKPPDLFFSQGLLLRLKGSRHWVWLSDALLVVVVLVGSHGVAMEPGTGARPLMEQP